VARGWESKSVEDQINEREAGAQQADPKKLSRLEIQQKIKRQSLTLARSRAALLLETTRDERYKALQQRTLDYLDSELAKLK